MSSKKEFITLSYSLLSPSVCSEYMDNDRQHTSSELLGLLEFLEITHHGNDVYEFCGYVFRSSLIRALTSIEVHHIFERSEFFFQLSFDDLVLTIMIKDSWRKDTENPFHLLEKVKKEFIKVMVNKTLINELE